MYKYLSKYLLLMGQARVSVTRAGVGMCHWWMHESGAGIHKFLWKLI